MSEAVNDDHGTLWVVNMYERTHIGLVPEILVIFGDNVLEKGYGGQAKACRDMPNVLGIPTKWAPAQTEDAYFHDDDAGEMNKTIKARFELARDALLRGQDVAYPFYGVGSGRALLESRAPLIMGCIHEGEDMIQLAARRIIRADNLYLVAARIQMDKTL